MKHTVRLLFDIDADNPEQAIDGFVEMVATYGLREWIYRVTSDEGSVLMTGTGKIVTIDELEEAAADEDAEAEMS